MTRTTIDLDPSVLDQLRARAKRERKSFGRLASELLALCLNDGGRAGRGEAFEWTSGNLRARIDIEDKEALQRILDRR